MGMGMNMTLGLTAPKAGTTAPGPINTVNPVISGTAEVGQVLTTTNGTWTGTPTITFAYQWTRNGESISGATSSTYTVQSADQGFQIRCRVTATNPDGSRNATSNAISIPAAPSGTTTFDSTAITFDSTTLTFDEAA
jgi:hypothetical protein